jgi:prepilin peptidase CpaA
MFTLFNFILISILLVCVFTDLKSRKIYNKVIFPSLVLTLGSHLLIGGWPALGSALIGFLIGLGILLVPYLLGGIGAGDVKLLALIGAIKGVTFVLHTAIYMAVIGAIIALCILLFRKGIGERFKSLFYFFYGVRYGVKVPLLGRLKESMSATYPYGVAIAGGTLISMYLEGTSILW